MDVDEPVVPVEKKDKDDLSAYNLDDYDNDIEVTNGPFTNIKGLTYYKDNNDDPYITLKDGDNGDEDERDELQVLPTDNLLVAAKTEDEISQLEIYVYDALNENLYVHHDLMLPNFPLCLEWLDFPPSQSQSPSGGPSRTHGNYIAVGTLDPEIEIWSLDTLDALYPDALLGRPDATKAHVPVPAGTGKKKKKKTKHRTTSPYYHVDAVLSLSWNKHQRNLLASASADRTVKLWDLNRGTGNANGAISVGAGDAGGDSGNGAIRSFDSLHSDKIQSVAWNPSPSSPSILLTASYDRTLLTLDTRAPASSVGALLGADPEAIRWDPFEPESFFVSLENGLVLNFDARMLVTNPRTNSETARARWTLAAHDGAVSGLDVNPHIRGCLATGGTDKLVKVWNVAEQVGDSEKRNVSLVTSRELGVGKVFSVGWCPDEPLTLSAAGSKAKMQIWDVSANGGARKAFAGKLKAAGRVLRERTQGEDGEGGGGGGVVGVVSDGEDSEDEDDGE